MLFPSIWYFMYFSNLCALMEEEIWGGYWPLHPWLWLEPQGRWLLSTFLSLPQGTIEIFSFFVCDCDIKGQLQSLVIVPLGLNLSKPTWKRLSEGTWGLEDRSDQAIQHHCQHSAKQRGCAIVFRLPGGWERRVQDGQSGCQNRF